MVATTAKTVSSPTKSQPKPAPKEKKTGPTYQEMILEAIKALADRKGSSKRAIDGWVIANYSLDQEKAQVYLKKALRIAIEKELVTNTQGTKLTGRFKLPKAQPKTASPEKAKKEGAAPKKAVAPKGLKKASEKKKEAAKKSTGKKAVKGLKGTKGLKSPVKKPAAKTAKKPTPTTPVKKVAKKAAPKSLQLTPSKLPTPKATPVKASKAAKPVPKRVAALKNNAPRGSPKKKSTPKKASAKGRGGRKK